MHTLAPQEAQGLLLTSIYVHLMGMRAYISGSACPRQTNIASQGDGTFARASTLSLLPLLLAIGCRT